MLDRYEISAYVELGSIDVNIIGVDYWSSRDLLEKEFDYTRGEGLFININHPLIKEILNKLNIEIPSIKKKRLITELFAVIRGSFDLSDNTTKQNRLSEINSVINDLKKVGYEISDLTLDDLSFIID